MKLSIDTKKIVGEIKLMNAVNNGPKRPLNIDQNTSNFYAYRDAHIPFARTHDASFCSPYGGEHCVDILAVFPNFDANVNDPTSYDFQLTDEYLAAISEAGTEVFYRLGSKIEHWSKKYGTVPPKDNQKWAEICEHIIAHYNEGWANGHHMGISYWEIWNEPDLGDKCWGGTPEQFYELFVTAAKHLKKRFPDIKIGGPAVAGYNEKWLRGFFSKVRDEKAPLDFYSWHIYAWSVGGILDKVYLHRRLLDEFGFNNVESILNEWNYVKGWTGNEWKQSLIDEVGIKGAAFAAGVMCGAQHTPVDMLMYYDARYGCGMNGLFDIYCDTRKTYHVIKTWGDMTALGNECETLCDVPDIWSVTAVKDGESVTMISYFSHDENPLKRTFKVSFSGEDKLRTIYLLDETHDLVPVETIASDNGEFTLTMEPNTVIVIK